MESIVEIENIAEVKLRQYFETETETLLKTLRLYVKKSHLAHNNEQIDTIALELLNDTFIEALKRPERFDASRPPKAWVLGIATNLIRQRRDKNRKLSEREITIDGLDDEFLERITSITTAGPELEVESRYFLETLMQQLSESDQSLLRLAMECDFSGQIIAITMGIKAGAARTKLHRALQRAKAIWLEQTDYAFENARKF